MKTLVLGGGQQGRVIASDLARSLPAVRVDVADVRAPALPELPNLRWVEADLSDPDATARLLATYDFGVGALPSRLGFGAMRAAIEAGRTLVDVSFCAQDALALDREARRAGVAILPDCGLAPGLSHLAVGHAAAETTPDEITIMVGGVAEDPNRPYGYVVTWSLEDLEEEYVRPARVVIDGRATTVPVFSGLERVTVEGVGEMEAFFSDGLRTLITTLPGVRSMGEKTLRWPGHAEAVRPLVASGRLIDEFRARCVSDAPRDLVVMLVRVRRSGRERTMTLVDRFDPASGLTAMSRTTALTTSAVAQLVAEGGVRGRGVLPLEKLGPDPACYRFVSSALEKRGVRLSWRES